MVRTFWRCLNIALDTLSYIVIYFLYTAFRDSVFTAAHVPTEARANLTAIPGFNVPELSEACECFSPLLYYTQSCDARWPGWGSRGWYVRFAIHLSDCELDCSTGIGSTCVCPSFSGCSQTQHTQPSWTVYLPAYLQLCFVVGSIFAAALVSTLRAFCFRIRLQTLKRVCVTALYSSRPRLKRSQDCSTEVSTGSFSTRTLQTIHSHWCHLIKIESSC